ncbi:MAG: PAS domain S-box protein [Thermodesulforhabdaceae bacterium]
MLKELIENAAFLFALSAVYSLFARSRDRLGIWIKLATGISFGVIAVAGMVFPVHYAPGIIYDGRSIIMTLAGLFGGGVTTAVAATIAIAWRVFLGGPGVWAGVASIVASGLVGLIFRRACDNRPEKVGILRLFLIGVVSHLAMLSCQLLIIPWPTGVSVIGRIWLPVMLVFPVATVLAGLLIGSAERNVQNEQQLRQSQSLLQRSQAVGRVGSWEFDHNQNRLTWSDEVYRIFGVDPQVFIPSPEKFLDCVHPEDREKVDAAWTRSLAEKADGYEVEYRIVRPSDKAVRVILEKCEHEKDDTGRVIRSVGIAQDITERKEAEHQLQRAKEFAEKLIRTANVIFVQLDNQGNIVMINEAAERITGYTLAEVQGKSWFEILVPKKRYPHVWEVFERIAQNGDVLKSFENPIITKNGEERYIVWQNSALKEGETFLGMISFGIDITELKRAELERERLIYAIEQTNEVVMITDADGIIQYVNTAFEKVTGFTRAEIIGKTPEILRSSQHDEAFYRNIWETIRTGRTWTGRIVRKRKDGSLFTVESTISPVKNETGQIVNFVFVDRDITEQLRLEQERASLEEQLQQAQKLESVGRLAGGVAHDFNNMLNVIIGYGEMVLHKLHNEDPLRDYVNKIMEAANRSAELIRQLLAFSRRQPLHPEVLNLNAIIQNLEKMLRRLIGEDIILELALADDLGMVMADPVQMEQVIINLAVNARDAMPKGGKLLIETANVQLDETYVRKHVGVQPGNYVMLAVTDTGCGMDKETLSRIFEPFFTTKEKGKGTGLGLSTVYGIVKQSGGHIWVYSEPGRGTTFKIYLPQTEAKQEPRTVVVTGETETARGGGEHILVVEDEGSLRKLIEVGLSSLGYKVTVAASGGEALLLVEEKGLKPDLVITDVVMPYISGKEMINRLQRNQPDLKVLYMSGYTDNAIVHHGILDPDIVFIQKPFTLRDLVKKVQEILQSGHK